MVKEKVIRPSWAASKGMQGLNSFDRGCCVCPRCDSDEVTVVGDGLFKCLSCGKRWGVDE